MTTTDIPADPNARTPWRIRKPEDLIADMVPDQGAAPLVGTGSSGSPAALAAAAMREMQERYDWELKQSQRCKEESKHWHYRTGKQDAFGEAIIVLDALCRQLESANVRQPQENEKAETRSP